MMRFILPFVIFLVLSVFLYKGLGRDTREVPSPLVGRAAPAFVLPLLHEPEKKFSPKDMQGKVWLLNVWASWCLACRDEHPVLLEAGRRAEGSDVHFVGLLYNDSPESGRAWIQEMGGRGWE